MFLWFEPISSRAVLFIFLNNTTLYCCKKRVIQGYKMLKNKTAEKQARQTHNFKLAQPYIAVKNKQYKARRMLQAGSLVYPK